MRRWKPTAVLDDVLVNYYLGVEDSTEFEFRHEIEEILSQIPEHYADVMRRFYLADMSIVDIARTMNLPVGTVKRRLFEGRRQFKSRWSSQTAQQQKKAS